MEPENFSTEWGVLTVFPSGSEHYCSVDTRSEGERMVRNMTIADSDMTSELVWRGVTPWMKVAI